MNNIDQLPPSPESVRTLIMKGGGVKGLAFAGALEVLESHGYAFDTFVGASAGSVGAVLLAAGFSAKELCQVLRDTDYRQFCDASLPRAIVNFVAHGGFYPGLKLRDWMNELLRKKYDRIEYPRVTMECFDKTAEKRVIIFATHPQVGTFTFDSHGENSSTEVQHAVRLSSSIPGFFIPERQDGTRIYDGGLLNNFPIEEYRRIQRTDQHAAAKEYKTPEDDFIAMYIGTPPSGKETWWVKEVFSIVLARDETLQLQAHKSRTLLLNTTPVNTTDFRLTDDEKRLLILVGKAAAHEFLKNDSQHRQYHDEAETLRNKVLNDRRRRRRNGWFFWGTTLSCASVVCMLIFAYVLTFFYNNHGARYRPNSNLRFPTVFINQKGAIQRLDKTPTDEIAGYDKDYGDQFTENSVRFDSVAQIVLLHGSGATKVEVLRTTLRESDMANHIILSSMSSGDKNADSWLLAFHQPSGIWKRHDWKKHDTSNSPGNQGKSDTTFTIGNDFQNGEQISVVSVTRYENLFHSTQTITLPGNDVRESSVPLDAIPWLVNSHRFLNENGQATYAFLKPKAENAERFLFPRHIFAMTSKEGSYVEISQRPVLLHRFFDRRHKDWTRISQTIAFLNSVTELLTGLQNDRHASAAMHTVIEETKTRAENFAATPERHFVFSLDEAETRELRGASAYINGLNDIVFIETGKSGDSETIASDNSQ